ncbi:MAG: DUF3311 domain-containing protein [Haloferacaceae archaeon]
MRGTWRSFAWAAAFLLLAALAVPWFMWGESTTAAGLPTWLWWHVGWMGLAALLFYAFTRDAWGRGMGVSGGG